MSPTNLYFLHGFLGTPSDWNKIILHLSDFHVQCHLIDFMKTPALNPENNFNQWAKNFNKLINPNENNFLIGYSMGGRLALHAIENNPSLWNQIILISTNPGILSPAEKNDRVIQDALWADKFLNNSWDQVMAEWNNQNVFSYSLPPARDAKSHNQILLAKALNQWSLGLQKNFSDLPDFLLKKITWIVGEQDERYMNIFKQFANTQKDINTLVAPEASHRVLFDNPKDVADLIQKKLRAFT